MAENQQFTELEKKFGELTTQLEGEKTARQAAEAQAKTLTEQVTVLSEQNQQFAERVTKMEKDARRKRFNELVDGSTPWYGAVDTHVSLLETMADTFGEESEPFKNYVSQQQAQAKALAESALFQEHGSNRSGGANDPLTQATQMANARAKEANIPFQDALNQVFAENPGLYAQYRQQTTVKV